MLLETISVFASGVHKLSEKLKEPKWLLDYRLKNAKVFDEKPLKKSMYLNIALLEQLLKEPASAEFELPKAPKLAGASVFTWEEALRKIPDKLRAALEQEHAPKDQFEAFINAWFNCGFVIVAGKKSDGGMVSFESVFSENSVGKIAVIIEDNQEEISFFEEVRGKEMLLLNETVFLGKGCAASFLRVHKNSDECRALVFQQTLVEKDARLLNSNAWLEGKLLRANTFNNIVGQGGSVNQLDFVLLDKSQLFDLNNAVTHAATDTQSYTEIKSVLAGRAKNIFDGMIKILPSGQQTNALLQAHSILLSDGASSNNIPGLEIEADDVRATHSASVVQILEEQVFYLESRGIKKSIAKQLIVAGFLESVILRLPEGFQAGLFSLIEKKMEKTNSELTTNA